MYKAYSKYMYSYIYTCEAYKLTPQTTHFLKRSFFLAMAGLHYNFFPTDFLYPKNPKPNLAIEISTPDAINLPRKTRNRNGADIILELQSKSLAHDGLQENTKLLKTAHDPSQRDNHHHHGKRYLKYLSPYPVSWVLWIPVDSEN